MNRHRIPGAPPHAVVYDARQSLVDVRTFRPEILCDLRYGTSDNVTGRALYPANMPCLLHSATAEKLASAQNVLRAQGLSLKIWDAWRPSEVQAELCRYGQATGRPTLFLNPDEAWSFHCSGTAVDITLVDDQGREMPMPSDLDEAGPRAHSTAPVSDPRVLGNLRALQNAMLQSGFTTIDLEWWHFDDADFKNTNTCLPVISARQMGLALPAAN